jgi:hypothetical protein
MEYYKNPKIEVAKGGYLVCYEKHMASKDAYDGLRYIGEEKEIFTEGTEALTRLDEIHTMSKSRSKEMHTHSEKKTPTKS